MHSSTRTTHRELAQVSAGLQRRKPGSEEASGDSERAWPCWPSAYPRDGIQVTFDWVLFCITEPHPDHMGSSYPVPHFTAPSSPSRPAAPWNTLAGSQTTVCPWGPHFPMTPHHVAQRDTLLPSPPLCTAALPPPRHPHRLQGSGLVLTVLPGHEPCERAILVADRRVC